MIDDCECCSWLLIRVRVKKYGEKKRLCLSKQCRFWESDMNDGSWGSSSWSAIDFGSFKDSQLFLSEIPMSQSPKNTKTLQDLPRGSRSSAVSVHSVSPKQLCGVAVAPFRHDGSCSKTITPGNAAKGLEENGAKGDWPGNFRVPFCKTNISIS